MAKVFSINLKIIVFQLLSIALNMLWILKLIHYFMQPLPFLFNSPSTIPLSEYETMKSIDQIDLRKTFFNILLFGMFFLQHFVMAALKWKIASTKLWPMYQKYERLLYNITSSLLLYTVLEYQQPNTLILFTLPKWFCLPLALFGGILFFHSDMQTDRPIIFLYSWNELFSGEKAKVDPDDRNKKKTKQSLMKGAYNYIRHPMQCGIILAITFGSHIFTFQKVVLVSVMLVFIFIGVRKEEGRLLKKFKHYKEYMDEVKYRFIPYVL